LAGKAQSDGDRTSVAAVEGRKSLSGTWNHLFRDHEIIVRTGGDVRFLLLSASAQRRAASIAGLILAAWLLGTAALLGWQAWTSWKTRDVAERAAAIAQAEARVAAERQSVESIARSIDTRQDQLEALVSAHFGTDGQEAALPGAERGQAAAPADSASAGAGVSKMIPAAAGNAAAGDQVARLQAAAVRQDLLVAKLGSAADRRSAEVETVLRQVGIRPSAVAARGGPFIPAAARDGLRDADPAIRQLAVRLDRMAQLESLLEAVPSGLPADRMELSSGFGPRYDPFNGQRAMHAGLDFTGPHGSPIRAAAAGRVIYAGVKNGYGNVVEIDHGHGIQTRYAHLSGFAARVGDLVSSGEQIGRMGSTGRSTGTHLHFEVRVGGTAVNPRRFLEANTHVLEVKADADTRIGSAGPGEQRGRRDVLAG
jgi:murein DD-endopeptidase MepM/ murein hydrolase activator NlpD